MFPNTPQSDTPESETMHVEQEEIDSSSVESVDTHTPLISWQSQPVESKAHRPTYWYVALGLIFAAAIVIAIWARAWFFIPLGFLVPWALVSYVNRPEEGHQYSLFPGGIQVDQKFYLYDLFKAYFIVEEPHRIIFELVPAKRLGGLVTLQAPADEVADIEDILDSVLPQTEPQGYIGESVFKRLKF